MVRAPRYFSKAQTQLATAQRSLARKKRGSHRRKQARRRVAKLHRKIANQRKDFHHKLARHLVNREDLNILAEEAGRRVVGVDPKHTSQDCPVCSHREKRPLWVREFTCPACGASLHRDVAAATNILARSGRVPDRRWARTEPAGMGAALAAPWSRAQARTL